MSAASYPDNLLCHREHDWARLQGDEATFGITWYAQDTLGEVVYFDPPGVGDEVTEGQPYAQIESVKSVSDLYAPLLGEVVQVNDALASAPRECHRGPLRAELAGESEAVGSV